MKRLLTLIMVVLILAACAVPIVAEAIALESGTQVRELDVNFNYDLATTLIIVICSVLTGLILAALIVLIKRNAHN